MTWNAEDAYDERLSPLVRQLVKLCKEHRIPAAICFQIADDEEKGPYYCATVMPFDRQSRCMERVQRSVYPMPRSEPCIPPVRVEEHPMIRRMAWETMTALHDCYRWLNPTRHRKQTRK